MALKLHTSFLPKHFVTPLKLEKKIMTLRNSELQFGKIREVDGSSISVRADFLEKYYDSQDFVIEIGSYVNCGGRHGDTICMVSRIQIEELERKIQTSNSINFEIVEVRNVILIAIGSVFDNQFMRGSTRLPTIGCDVFFLSDKQINSFLGIEEDEAKEKKHFLVSDASDDKAYFNLDKLLSRHTAILGTTGSGKSCTVASIMQSILQNYPYPRIVFFDLHNEYPNAFGHGEIENDFFRQKTKCTSWDQFSLPYWFLDLEEFLEIYYPGAGTNQLVDIKNIITNLKSENPILDTLSKNRVSADSPIYFDIDKLIEKLKSNEASETTAAKKEHWKKLELKFEAINRDTRYSFLRKDISKPPTLSEFFQGLFGINSEQKNYLNILDLSGLPSEVRNVCIGVLSRLCFDYKYWDLDPEDLPLTLVLEEAHTYIPEESSSRFSLCKERVERIAKEGRKYGLSLIVVSQRPSNISTTVLSQCGTFITLRLTNDIDQNKVKRFLPDTLGSQADMLPNLRDGEALVSGDGIRLPRKVKFRTPSPMPKSNDVKYHRSWNNELSSSYSVEKVIRGWTLRDKQK